MASLNETLAADYAVRREMLLKRLDVTVESFLWSAKAQGREAEIQGAIAGRRRALAPTPASICPEDAFAGKSRALVVARGRHDGARYV